MLPFVGIVSMGVVHEERMIEGVLDVSKTIEVRHMATHEHEKRALTVASAC